VPDVLLVLPPLRRRLPVLIRRTNNFLVARCSGTVKFRERDANHISSEASTEDMYQPNHVANKLKLRVILDVRRSVGLGTTGQEPDTVFAYHRSTGIGPKLYFRFRTGSRT